MDGDAPKSPYQELAVELIDESATNPRKTFDEAHLVGLAASIAITGLIQPITVRPMGERYSLVVGACRLRATVRAGLTTILAIVRELDDAAVEEIQLIENAARADVRPLEEAEAIDRQIRVHKRTVEYVAAKLGRAPRWVQLRRALLNLVDGWRVRLTDGRLPLGHAQQLAAIDRAAQDRVLKVFAPVAGAVAGRDLPTARAFAREITYALHLLSGAPFAVDDGGLPGGECPKCPKRSDTQPDLFGDEGGAHCLDNGCWDGKIAVTWERAEKAARKRHLTILDAPLPVTWDGTPALDRAEGCGGYTLAKTADAKPVAVGRTDRGKVVELYERPAATSAKGVEAPEDEDTDADTTADDVDHAARLGREARQREAMQAAVATRRKQIADATATPRGLVLVGRMALLSIMYEQSIASLLHTLAPLDVVILPTAKTDEAAIVAAIPDALVMRALAAYVAEPRLSVIDELVADDTTEQAPCERELRALMAGEVAPADLPHTVAMVSVWITVEQWDALAPDDRAALEEPSPRVAVAWDGKVVGGVEYVTATVSDDEVLDALKLEANNADIALHVGDAPPPVVETKRSAPALRVKRGDWLTHRSGLQDTAKAPLHKKWRAEGDDRVVDVEHLSDTARSKVLTYCLAHGVTLFSGGVQVSPPPARAIPAPKVTAKKSTKKAAK